MTKQFTIKQGNHVIGKVNGISFGEPNRDCHVYEMDSFDKTIPSEINIERTGMMRMLNRSFSMSGKDIPDEKIVGQLIVTGMTQEIEEPNDVLVVEKCTFKY
jgi:hypothetical protein